MAVDRPDGRGDHLPGRRRWRPGASTTCTTTYTLTQADVDAGPREQHRDGQRHAADRRSRPGDRHAPTRRSPARAAITLDKQAGAPSGNTAGSTIAYTFLVTNTGNVTLTSVGVTDPKVGAVTCPATTLAPGAIDDVHGDLHADPGRRRRRASWPTPRPRPGTPPTGRPASTRDRLDRHRRSPRTARSRSTSRRARRRATAAGSTIAYSLRRDQHRQRHPDVGRRHRPEGRSGHLPGDDAGAGRVDDVHGDVHADPGRRRRRARGQHRDRDRARRRPGADRADGHRHDRHPDHRGPAPITLDKQAGARRRATRAGSTDRLHLRRDQHRQRDPDRGRRRPTPRSGRSPARPRRWRRVPRPRAPRPTR